MIPNSLARWFPDRIRDRGDALVTGQKVLILGSAPDVLEAVVVGTQQYVVTVTASPRALDLSCTCPYAADNGACKHLWALLRAADSEGTLAPLLHSAGARHTVTFFAFDDDGLDVGVDSGLDVPSGDGEADEAPHAGTPRVEGQRQDAPPVRMSATGTPPRRSIAPPLVPDWMRVIDGARQQMQYQTPAVAAARPATWPADRRLVYLFDLEASATTPGIMLDVGTQRRTRDGDWSEAKRFTMGVPVWYAAPDPVDHRITAMLCGADQIYPTQPQRTTGFLIGPRAFSTTLQTIVDTGRCQLRSTVPELCGRTLRYDDGPPWAFQLRLGVDPSGVAQLDGLLVRDDQVMSIRDPLMMNASGFMIVRDDTIARLDHGGAFPLLLGLRGHGGSLEGPGDIATLLARLYSLPQVPALQLPEGLSVVESLVAPVPRVIITTRTSGWNSLHACYVACDFGYGNSRVLPSSPAERIFDEKMRVLHHRDVAFEGKALARLTALGVREEYDYAVRQQARLIARSRLTEFALTLVREGWDVSVEGIRYAAPGAISAQVSSGIDWFDLRGTVAYGDTDVPIATVLDAHGRGDAFVTLGDGSMGLMPTHWLQRLGPLVAIGERVDGRVRYRRSQLSLLDALLATLPEANVDATFQQARTELATFAAVQAADPPSTFRGTLREYQREGLGWMHFLRRFGLGGCLADDMGLGKTVQVLALLEARRLEGCGPSIVVVPRSLVFNWLREAERFTPQLRLLDFSGGDRSPESIDATRVDVVVVTYGSLRRDAPMLADIQFDYAILDEAQAIKNSTTATAKASRLLRSQHRLAMSGTPIENRIEELWSLLEFLNPGMLGAATKFSALARPAPAKGGVPEARLLLAQALRPVILRRTKEHVAPELPARTEQTLEVELEPKQRKFYESIRKAAQQRVMAQVEKEGMRRSQVHILEALLRLRQAACHPALIDSTKATLPSAKLDALVPALASIVEEGHKALVFSQFTSFLALVRQRLDAAQICYEYLDGSTRDRQARVDRFQTDADCRVFLISLKAGGHGLNLTAADYVYLLDPWWNPAVEAQAIDRAHRIGQVRAVMATRLVARDTIEAKILQLQATKRELADAVLMADKGGMASIGRSELELLLG